MEAAPIARIFPPQQGARVESADHEVADEVIVLARARPFRLGEVEVRPATREIIGPGGREVLEPRVMQVLVCLARSPGSVVSRDQLTAACWEGRVVGEDAISRVISRLRRHSEGVGRDGWTMETVTKVGYRLVPLGFQERPAQSATPSRPVRRLALIGAAATLAAGGAGLGLVLNRREPAVSPEARALYDKAREALRQGQPESTAQAIGFFREAVDRQPEYAAAWGGLARAYQASIGFTEPAQQAGVRGRARAAAQRAIQLEADQPDAAATLALLEPVYRNWGAAEALFRRALALHPKEPALLAGYGALTAGLGRLQEALKAMQGAMAAEPYAPYYRNGVALMLWSVGRTEEAESILIKGLALWPRHRALWFPYFNLLALTGRPRQAIALAEAPEGRPTAPPEDFDRIVAAANALATHDAASIAAAARAQFDAARHGAGYAEIALTWLSALGHLDDAFVVARGMYLDEGFELSQQRYSADQGRFEESDRKNTRFLFSAGTAPMRTDPRFPDLVRDIGIAAYWKSSGRPPDDPKWLPRG